MDGRKRRPGLESAALGGARQDVGFGFAGADLRIGKLRWQLVFVVDLGG